MKVTVAPLGDQRSSAPHRSAPPRTRSPRRRSHSGDRDRNRGSYEKRRRASSKSRADRHGNSPPRKRQKTSHGRRGRQPSAGRSYQSEGEVKHLQARDRRRRRERSATASEDASDSFESKLNCYYKSVIKVFADHLAPNYSMPWQTGVPDASVSSGFVIDGKRILCNAHGIANATMVQVRRHGDAEKYIATVAHVSHEADLALLTVVDKTFWQGLKPLQFGAIPHLQDEVTTVGYPEGGEYICVTKGVVSRLDMIDYSHSGIRLFGIQIDAPINGGNSGGPVLLNGRVVGVAFEAQGGEDIQNISYMIPVPIITHFLEDIKLHGEYTGLGWIGFAWERMENRYLRKKFGLIGTKDKPKTGVRVRETYTLCDSAKKLKKNDVVLACDGKKVAGDGSITLRGSQRVTFSYMANLKYPGDKITLKIIRKGETMDVNLRLGNKRKENALAPYHLFDEPASYFVFAGMVFTRLSVPYLESVWDDKWEEYAPSHFQKYFEYGDTGCNTVTEKKRLEQVVILSQILASAVTKGYDHFANDIVKRVNGIRLLNIKHLIELVEGNDDPYLEIEFEDKSVIVLEMKVAKRHDRKILKQYQVGANKSTNLRHVKGRTKEEELRKNQRDRERRERQKLEDKLELSGDKVQDPVEKPKPVIRVLVTGPDGGPLPTAE